VLHRKKVTPVRGIDYSNHSPEKINLIPPDEVIGEWKKDYKIMQVNMFYNPSLPFNELMDRMKELNNRINSLTNENQ
ncbi:MAG: nucleotidyl transferase AbiEii/AbiGii toxin family protein, partial [Bacteroidales bacterium]|nr:nucleotidyl transferase AbiEii/AbiGii toxin family protein [Bacteroidales bacterium]